MQEINSTQKKNISGKLIGAVILLLLGVVLALAYPSKQGQRASTKSTIQVSQTVKRQAVQKTASRKQVKKPKIKKRQVPAVIQEEEEGC